MALEEQHVKSHKKMYSHKESNGFLVDLLYALQDLVLSTRT